jgi:hypothetical protein
MQAKPTSKIVLVDDMPQGPTARILVAAASSSLLGRPLEIITIEQAQHHIAAIDSRETTIFVSIPETALSSRSGDLRSPRIACKSLNLAQSLVQANGYLRVILVLPAGTSLFTGLDTVAALLAGMAGIVDDRLLIADGVLAHFLHHNHLDHRNRTMLILGDPAHRLQTMKTMLEAWSLDVESDEMIDTRCFRTALALAQLERLKPLRGPGLLHSFDKLAQALNIEEPITSFKLSPGDLRKVMSKLADRLLSDEHEPTERLKLSEYARENGFPSHLPLVRGIPEKDVPKRLHKACLLTDIIPFAVVTGLNLWTAKLSHKEFRHLPKVRLAKGD